MSLNECNDGINAINILVGFGKMGTRVQILKENGDLYPDQLFFKSITSRRLSWNDNKKFIEINRYILVLPGKITGLLSIAPSVNDIDDSLCLGIVSKDYVLEIIFQNARDCNIWSQGLTILVSNPSLHFAKIKDLIQLQLLHQITIDEKKKIEQFYSFLLNSDKGSVFYQYQTKKLKSPQKVLIKLNQFGDQLFCINLNNNLLFKIVFDSEINIVDKEKEQNIHCFSIIRNDIELHLGCNDIQQYKLWRFGLQFLCNKKNHCLRMRVRRCILNGDLILTQKNQLIESSSSSSKKSNSFWSSLFE